jgi:hypothetical protein
MISGMKFASTYEAALWYARIIFPDESELKGVIERGKLIAERTILDHTTGLILATLDRLHSAPKHHQPISEEELYALAMLRLSI